MKRRSHVPRDIVIPYTAPSMVMSRTTYYHRICNICMEIVFLPVEIMAFDCYNSQSITCSSFHRYCRACVHQYLQLDRPIMEREMMKRCLFCPRTCHLRFLTHDKAYRYDFVIMQFDEHVYPCPLCQKVMGTQIFLTQHMTKTCENYRMTCECGQVMERKHQPRHQTQCPCFQRCTVCEAPTLRREYAHHLYSVHHMIECPDCHSICLANLLPYHAQHYCPQRMVVCPCCDETTIPFLHLRNHLEAHGRALEEEMYIIKNQLLHLLRKYRHVQQQLRGSHIPLLS